MIRFISEEDDNTMDGATWKLVRRSMEFGSETPFFPSAMSFFIRWLTCAIKVKVFYAQPQAFDHAQTALDVLESKSAAIRDIAKCFDAGLSVSGDVHTSVCAGVHLSSAELGRLANLGLSLDIDLNVLTVTSD